MVYVPIYRDLSSAFSGFPAAGILELMLGRPFVSGTFQRFGRF
jgi:hypothetical protein